MPNDKINFQKIFADIQRNKDLITEKTPVDYGWTKAVSGEGEVVPDAIVWKRRYEDECEQNRIIRGEVMELSLAYYILKRKLEELGVTSDEIRVLLQNGQSYLHS